MLWAQRLVLAPLTFWCLAVVALPDNNTPLPSFTDFINKSYTGTRFTGKSVVVVGGTSGIGFAAAAMFVQECASSVLLIGRNAAKGQLSADVINAEASQAHCATHNGANVTSFAEANVRHRGELRAAFANRTIHVLVNTAGIPGWTGALPDIPDEAWLGEQDSIQNNLYGSINVMAEALRLWKFDHGGKGPGYKPNIVNLASEQGLTPTPGYLMYGVSKAGIIAATQTVAASQPGLLRANVVAPGLVDTPLTWNQARGLVLQNGTLKPSPLGPVQFGFQCINKDGTKVIEQGDCPGTGGTGYTCPCPDVRRDDPRLKPMFAPLGILPVDPRLVAASVLNLATEDSKANGDTVVVDNVPTGHPPSAPWSCPSMPLPLKYGSCCAPSTKGT